MTLLEILSELNSCYTKIENIVQQQEWQQFINQKETESELDSHLTDTLYYLTEAIGCVEENLEDK